MSSSPPIVVIGAGVAGLSISAALRARGREAIIFESSDRAGGKIRSIRDGDFLLEAGPAGFVDTSPEVQALLTRLNLQSRIIRSGADAQRRFLYLDGRLVPAPDSPLSAARSVVLSRSARLRALGDLVLPRGPSGLGEEESVADLARRRLGSDAADRIIAPFVSGLFAGDPEALSAAAAYPKLAAAEHDHRSLLVAAWRAWKEERSRPGALSTHVSFVDGMQELTNALGQAAGASLHLGATVKRIEKRGDIFEIYVEEAGAVKTLTAAGVALTVPAFVAAPLVAPLDAALADAAAAIPYAPIAVIHLAYNRSAVRHPLDGYGFLAPAGQGLRILGAAFSSNIYDGRAPSGTVLFLARLGGANNPDLAALPEDALIATVHEDLSRALGIDAPPIFARVFRHPRAMPQYTLGHLKRVATIEAAERRVGKIALAGNAYRGLALTDCIREADAITDRLDM